ncbi:TIR domain-containing protein [Frankia sp. R82]|uniref:TIR domain-containing protein n=1 Tax=Frankia sp. R82 TaxID=2950553 RepID=UPI002044A138|nr:TIR domain-containing protein [Frankia sp. R82]MCM3883112.1 TIR domain-containing protein [Frankia sp. R82]
MGREAGEEAAAQDFFISYADADRGWAEWIAWTLEEAGYRVLIQAWDFTPGSSWESRLSQGISLSRTVLVILSAAYTDSVFSEGEWQAAWSSDPDGSRRRILPVKVDDTYTPPPGLLSSLVYLNLAGLSESAARDRLLSGLSAALSGRSKAKMAPEFPQPHSLPPSDRRKPAAEPDFPVGREAPFGERQTSRLEDVFQPVGVPSVTFVAPKEYIPFRLALRQRGLCVVVEGPSGIGKTTLLDWAVSQDSARLGPVVTYTARKPDDVGLIKRLPLDGHIGIIVIDDFHRLPDDTQRLLVDYLKRLADDPNSSGKLVIIGIPETAASLVSASFDVANRIRVFRLGPASRKQIGELIAKGEGALNISFKNKKQIIRTSAGSLITAQSLCSHLAALAGVEETMPEQTVVQTDLHAVRAQVADELRIKYRAAVYEFAAMDAPNEATCVDLLLEIGRTDDGVVALDNARTQSLSLMMALKRIGPTAGQDPPESLLARHFFYDARSNRVMADDPQLLFYLRQLRRDTLMSEVGKRLPTPRDHAFVCYSHADTGWQERLLMHLDPLERMGVIDVWSDKRIEIGANWEDEITYALDRARFAILLISADFLASDFIRRVELPALLTAAEGGGCRVVPILVRASAFSQTPELSRFQHANPGGKTLASLSEEEAEQVLANVARWLISFINKGST